MDFNDRFKELRKDIDIIPEINGHNKKETDIITQLSNYNYNDTIDKIKEFEKILINQQNLNQILSKNNSKQDTVKIESFINDNSKLIDQQFFKLKKLNYDLKSIIQSNDKLIKENEEYNNLINSKNYNDIAYKIREINKNCSEINHFLVNTGILDA